MRARPIPRLPLIIAASVAATLGLAVACGGTAVIDPGSSTGGSGGSSSNSNTSTSTAGPAPGPGPVSSSSGGGPCVSCSEYLLDATGTVMFEELCGYDFQNGSCTPNSSCSKVEAIDRCSCGDPMGGPPGLCTAECQLSCTGMGMDQMNCQDCVLNNCSGQANECLADPGTP